MADAYLYRYKNKKVKKINSRSIYAPFSGGKITKVTKNSFTVKAYTTKYDNGYIYDAAQNGPSFRINFSINGYKIKRKSKYLKTYSYFQCSTFKDFWTSTEKTYNNYNGPNMYADEGITIIQAYAYDDYSYSLQIEDDYGNKGWVIDEENDWDNPYFY